MYTFIHVKTLEYRTFMQKSIGFIVANTHTHITHVLLWLNEKETQTD